MHEAKRVSADFWTLEKLVTCAFGFRTWYFREFIEDWIIKLEGYVLDWGQWEQLSLIRSVSYQPHKSGIADSASVVLSPSSVGSQSP